VGMELPLCSGVDFATIGMTGIPAYIAYARPMPR
jgi:hypothetical protein